MRNKIKQLEEQYRYLLIKYNWDLTPPLPLHDTMNFQSLYDQRSATKHKVLQRHKYFQSLTSCHVVSRNFIRVAEAVFARVLHCICTTWDVEL